MEGYKNLSSYILATVIYDLNQEFLRRWVNPKSRNWDQMDQAGRSGKQNIAEGYTMQSLESYIKLLGVANASLEELISDFEDFLRQRGFEIWPKTDKRVTDFRKIGFRLSALSNLSNLGELKEKPVLPANPQNAANLLLTLCHQATFLLSRQISKMEEIFIKEGGFTENLFKKRLNSKIVKLTDEFP